MDIEVFPYLPLLAKTISNNRINLLDQRQIPTLNHDNPNYPVRISPHNGQQTLTFQHIQHDLPTCLISKPVEKLMQSLHGESHDG